MAELPPIPGRKPISQSSVPRPKPDIRVIEALSKLREFERGAQETEEFKKRPLAGLGFDVGRIVPAGGHRAITSKPGYIDAGKYYPGQTFGAMDRLISESKMDFPREDMMYLAGGREQNMDTVSHESRHRGLQLLRLGGVDVDKELANYNAARDKGQPKLNEELFVGFLGVATGTADADEEEKRLKDIGILDKKQSIHDIINNKKFLKFAMRMQQEAQKTLLPEGGGMVHFPEEEKSSYLWQLLFGED